MIELFGERVLALLTERGVTQRELAEATGLTEVTISRYMTGLRKPKSDNVVSIAEVLGVTTDYLLRGKRDAQQWIPCSERIPEESQKVLACNITGFICVAQCYGEDRWYEDGGFGRIYIDAWMPLPQPYREDGESDGKN